jgi:hypothetical protein
MLTLARFGLGRVVLHLLAMLETGRSGSMLQGFR